MLTNWGIVNLYDGALTKETAMGEWKGIEKLAAEIYDVADEAYQEKTARETIAEIRERLKAELEPLLNAAQANIEFYDAHGGPMADLMKAVERWK